MLNPAVDDDFIPIFYNNLFIFINVYYVLRWQLDRQVRALGLEIGFETLEKGSRRVRDRS